MGIAQARGASMRPMIQGAAILFAFAVLLVGQAEARTATTTTDLALRSGPSSKTELLLTMPAGAAVAVGSCSAYWCKVTWNSYSGYARKSGLAIGAERQAARAVPTGRPYIPVFPRYPYRAGHYPKADWYYDLPPYAAIVPSFYRRRFFMLAQERDRYRYMPHIFSGYNGDAEIDYGPDVNIELSISDAGTDLSDGTKTKP
jgi:uncharacterized protein YraI